MKKTIMVIMSFFVVGILFCGPSVSAKTITKSLKLLQGTTRYVEHNSSDVKKLKVKNKKYISVKGKSYLIKVTGKKVGKTSFTYRPCGDKNGYKCNVTVYSVKKVKKKADKALKKVLKKLPNNTSYAFVDFNKDGIKELFYDGKITHYDYVKNKCYTKDYGFKEIYQSKKTKRIYAIKNEPIETDCFTYFSEFYTVSLTKLFALTGEGTGFRTYTEKGLQEYNASAPYAYYDDHYDQDDYDYEALTESDVNARIEEKMPGYKKVVLKKK